MAELSLLMRESEKAAHLYKEALTLSPSDPDILLALAKLYMQVCIVNQIISIAFKYLDGRQYCTVYILSKGKECGIG